MVEYRVDVGQIGGFDDFVAAFNVGLIERCGGRWHGGLDAFNVYLFWPEPHPYRLVLVGWTHAKAVLARLPYPGSGTMLAVVEEVLRDNPQAVVTIA